MHSSLTDWQNWANWEKDSPIWQDMYVTKNKTNKNPHTHAEMLQVALTTAEFAIVVSESESYWITVISLTYKTNSFETIQHFLHVKVKTFVNKLKMFLRQTKYDTLWHILFLSVYSCCYYMPPVVCDYHRNGRERQRERERETWGT